MADHVSRKDFVTLVGTVAAVEALPATTAADAATPHYPALPKPLGSEPEAYTFLTEPEAAFVEAAVERLIPADALGPGGREAGVAFYIDQQLSGQFGYAAKMYRQGPWEADASPDFGYQLTLTPQQVYRLGIAATNVYCNKIYGKTFDKLSDAQSGRRPHGARRREDLVRERSGKGVLRDALRERSRGLLRRSALRRTSLTTARKVTVAFHDERSSRSHADLTAVRSAQSRTASVPEFSLMTVACNGKSLNRQLFG